ncbi:autophagy protein 12-like isoform X2 [Agrilus planipennis]|uniref:Ubiquitin-like protein ATG12 n=1 Tax=Agrilus planipennis TaxID=224129 RepID=A0A7F5RGP1_AGRPL|nr:autophagy protein 12-like isoform X2 [Agrilus planipennis]
MSEGTASDSVSDANSETQSLSKNDSKQKVDILLKPTGNAPIMKKKKWTVDADKQLGWIIEFVKKYLKLDSEEQLTFAPSPDQTVRNLYDCYSTEGKLVLHYCKTQAWG